MTEALLIPCSDPALLTHESARVNLLTYTLLTYTRLTHNFTRVILLIHLLTSQALEVAPDHIHSQFNVALVQSLLAQLVYSLPESERTLVQVEAAADGLDAAIDAFTRIAQSPNPPVCAQ